MTKTLDVYLQNDLVGHLFSEHGQIEFEYANSWLASPNAKPLSHSLLLQAERFTRNECRGFFAGVLPEAHKRELIAKNFGISPRNDFSILEKIGGECAGAVTFVPAGESLPQGEYHYTPLADADLLYRLEQLPTTPLMAGEDGIRLSLAGAQDKLAVHVKDGKISIPLGGAPSTHIIKPAIREIKDLVYNEAFCMQLAKAAGLPVANVEVRTLFDKLDYLLVERYDRVVDAKGNVQRLHQEDFCQALGVVPENKYQSEGGPSLKQCFALLREVSSKPVVDLGNLLDAVIFNVLIGNHDAHGKNFSLLYQANGTTQLSPLYDLICTVYYPNLAKKMAMKLGGEGQSDRLYPRHFEKLADEAGLAKPMVKQRAVEMTERITSALDKVAINHPSIPKLSELISERCNTIRARF